MMYQPVLKSKKCRNYHTNGYCRFGIRCNFRHEKAVKPRKKKNMYKFHKMFSSYPELILGSLINKNSNTPSNSECSESSVEWFSNFLYLFIYFLFYFIFLKLFFIIYFENINDFARLIKFVCYFYYNKYSTIFPLIYLIFCLIFLT